jgi:hypothetical protein
VKLGAHGYHLQNQTKLSYTKTGPYWILQVNPLSCKIELPDWLSIHPVISVEHLEPALAPNTDQYDRSQPAPGPLTIDSVEKFVIDRIVCTETRNGQ